LRREIGILARDAREPALVKISALVERVLEQAGEWLADAKDDALEAGARRLALTVGRALELALLLRHAQWSLDAEHDSAACSAVLRFAAHGVSRLAAVNPADTARLLGNDKS
jgi:hypothetical protein